MEQVNERTASRSLEEQLKKLFREGDKSAYKFSFLTKYLGLEVATETIDSVLEILKEQALLVQGLWVPKSSTLQLAAIEALARDFVILKFSKQLTIDYEEVRVKHFELAVNIRAELRNFAVESQNDWKFKTEPDTSFPSLYPAVALQQSRQLQSLEPFLLAYINDSTETSLKASDARCLAPTLGIAVTAETQEALLKALPLVFTYNSVPRFVDIRGDLWKRAVTASSSDNDINWRLVESSCIEEEKLKSVLEHFAIEVHKCYVQKSSPVHPELDSLRTVVIQLFRSKPVNGKVNKNDVMKAYKKDVSDHDYMKVMKELCYSVGPAWVMKRS